MPKPKMSAEVALQKVQYRKEFGERLAAIRTAAGMTQEELAQKMGYKSKTSINKIEMGKQDVSQSKITAFADALSVTVDELMGWQDEPSTVIAVGTYEVDLIKNFRLLSEIGKMKILLTVYQELQAEQAPAEEKDAASLTSRVG